MLRINNVQRLLFLIALSHIFHNTESYNSGSLLIGVSKKLLEKYIIALYNNTLGYI